MGVFGEFIYGGESVGGDVYGPEESISADLLGEEVIVLRLDNTVVVNDDFKNADNYTITVVEGSGENISVRSIISPTGRLTTNEILVEVDVPTKGTTYRVTVSNLVTDDGNSVEGAGLVIGRRHKLDSMLRGMAAHWDKRPRSIMRNFLAAISIEDDRIGGSRLDDL